MKALPDERLSVPANEQELEKALRELDARLRVRAGEEAGYDLDERYLAAVRHVMLARVRHLHRKNGVLLDDLQGVSYASMTGLCEAMDALDVVHVQLKTVIDPVARAILMRRLSTMGLQLVEGDTAAK